MRYDRITRSDIINKTGLIEAGEPLHKKPKAAPTGTLGFGKYRDKTYAWVKEHDGGYWDWAIENINGFAAKAARFS